ncbi:hypothetical protein [Paracoccus sp. ME4]|uniref:hypothetical protein n=1 Tax=Paracoccus sp. ME4 TaxID=3138066 RepID=UPI00398B4A30
MTATDPLRALDREERELDAQSQPDILTTLDDRQLTTLIGLLRLRRNRARDISARQGREMRGKVAPKGSTAAGGNEGTRSKAELLTAALDRATAERERRGTVS